MKKSLGVGVLVSTFLLAGLLLAAAAWGVYSHNQLTTEREQVQGQWAQVENQMQRRFDLIPNLIESVRGQLAQADRLSEELRAARLAYQNSKTISQKVRHADALQQKLGSLLEASRKTPKLRSSPVFLGLMDELAGTENRLAVERKRFNEAVTAYNLKIKLFPHNLLASIGGFEPLEHFQMAPGASQSPKVSFP